MSWTKWMFLVKKSVELNTIKHSENVEFEIYSSYHDRKFEWMKNKGKACEIELTHLWLQIWFPIKKSITFKWKKFPDATNYKEILKIKHYLHKD